MMPHLMAASVITDTSNNTISGLSSAGSPSVVTATVAPTSMMVNNGLIGDETLMMFGEDTFLPLDTSYSTSIHNNTTTQMVTTMIDSVVPSSPSISFLNDNDYLLPPLSPALFVSDGISTSIPSSVGMIPLPTPAVVVTSQLTTPLPPPPSVPVRPAEVHVAQLRISACAICHSHKVRSHSHPAFTLTRPLNDSYICLGSL
jgi:hypothetical protein